MNNTVIEALKEGNYANQAYGSLHTIFSSTGKRSQPFGERACFGSVLKYTSGDMHNTYTIYTYTKNIPSLINLCIFTPEEIRKYLEYIAGIIPFSFTVSDITEPTEDDKKEASRRNILTEPYIKIFVDINGPHLNHVFVLTLIRYLYEYPYKFILADVFRMKEVPEFSKLNLFNIYNALAFSIDISSYGMHLSNDMSHYTGLSPVLFLRKENIKERMAFLTENVENQDCVASILDIFPINDYFKQPPINTDYYYKPKPDKFSKYGFKFIKMQKGNTMCKEFLDDSYWPGRLEIYRNNIQLLIDATDEQIQSDTEKHNQHLTTFRRYGC